MQDAKERTTASPGLAIFTCFPTSFTYPAPEYLSISNSVFLFIKREIRMNGFYYLHGP